MRATPERDPSEEKLLYEATVARRRWESKDGTKEEFAAALKRLHDFAIYGKTDGGQLLAGPTKQRPAVRKLPCVEKVRLIEDWRNTNGSFVWATRELRLNLKNGDRAVFDDSYKLANDCRSEVCRAHAALASHQELHGC